jgi:pyruvate,water dikinase
MVQAEFSGVAFSANPITGFTETIIEAVPGLGEGLMQRGETPERWIRKAGAWRARPDAPELPENVAEQVAADVAEMARRYKQPVDVEWVLADSRLSYVQLRPITGIGEITYYSNRFSREMLPGVIVPLVWSVNIPVVNGVWIGVLDRLAGPTGLTPNDLAARFYCRAYFNMGSFGTILDKLGLPRESLEMMRGMERSGGGRPAMRITFRTLTKLPRALLFAAGLLGHERKARRLLAKHEAEFGELLERLDLDTGDSAHLLRALDELRPISEGVAYLNVLTPLLSEAHNHRLARRLSRIRVEYHNVDFANRDEGDERRDPTLAICRLHDAWEKLVPELQGRLGEAGVDALRREPPAREFVALFDRFIEGYGHFSDSGNDFSHVPWREDQAAVIRLIEAQVTPRSSAVRVTREDIAARPGGRRCLRAFDRASRFQVLREDVSSLFTLCHGYHRPLYLRLAERCGMAEWLPDGRAAFYLFDSEIRALAAGQLGLAEARRLVGERFEEEQQVRDAAVPDEIFGDSPGPLRTETGGTLSGVGTSPGRHTGRAVKISSVSQAPELTEGDVIVVPYSDVAWTPLFSRAGAIVAESGGFLSHTSIVAREYGIPAVVSVDAAMFAIPQGAQVEVDGFSGTVTVLEDENADEPLDETGALE